MKRGAENRTQLVKKVFPDFFDCAFPAKHFARGKMLLRPKILENQCFSVADYRNARRALPPRAPPLLY